MNSVPDNDHIWSLNGGLDFEVSLRGYTQSMAESMKDLKDLTEDLIDLPRLDEQPRGILVGENLRMLSWLTGLAFDLKTNKVLYTPIASEKLEER